MENVEVTVLSIRDVSIEHEVENTAFNAAESQNLVVAIGEVSGHGATSFIKDTVFSATGSVAPSCPRLTKSLSNLVTSSLSFEIEVH